ncbi:tRNA synthetases class I, catalytic domain-containing protein [Phlyctochytrium arcticum]|nr:tRNA synthetases class I, catalytic domain-containing protein [Phlyctochytrium arcticum]
MADHLADLFQKIGLSDVKAKETAANKKLAPRLEQVIREAGDEQGAERSLGALYYTLASTITPKAQPHLPYIAKAIKAKKLTTGDQIAAAIKYSEKTDPSIDEAKFDQECGVGIEVSPEEINETVAKLFQRRSKDLEEKRYTMLGPLLGELRTTLKWANPQLVKEKLDRRLLATLGPKDERDNPKTKKKQEKKEKEAANSSATKSSVKAAPTPTGSRVTEVAKSTKFIFEGELSRLHKAGENPQIDPKLMQEHLKRTGGKVITRFPPEPNGFLHIGHAKAINVNFGFAAAHKGITYLRYDDTNPEAEEEIYFTSILETIRWLGYEPSDITYSSDHFQRLYDLAVELIKRDKGYICHCTGEEIHAHRGGDAKGPRTECVHRNRPIEESLAEFQKMKDGKYKEGEAILRMKMDMQNPNPQFWDLVAYRVLKAPHHRTADKWCIYPTYDFTHCLCDSFEDITHSLCTTEFTLSRESYYWLVDALGIYKPVQWEYGRLNLAYTVMSKRKLRKLVEGKLVNGWDDPRLFTMAGIRRRGFTPEAINAFVRELGVTTANSVIHPERLENIVREHLNDVAPRIMLILEPLKITITNLPEDHFEEITLPNKPRDDSMGTHVVPFTRTVYIDRSDFREQDDPNFYRLAPGKTVGLLNVAHPITATDIIKDAAGHVVEVKARYENGPEGTKKPKTYIHWIAESPKHNSPAKVEVRLYSNLFLHENPQSEKEVPGGWLSDINPESLVVVPEAFAEVGINALNVEDKFQAVRTGYFCVDKDSDVKSKRYVLNRTVKLREDSSKDK